MGMKDERGMRGEKKEVFEILSKRLKTETWQKTRPNQGKRWRLRELFAILLKLTLWHKNKDLNHYFSLTHFSQHLCVSQTHIHTHAHTHKQHPDWLQPNLQAWTGLNFPLKRKSLAKKMRRICMASKSLSFNAGYTKACGRQAGAVFTWPWHQLSWTPDGRGSIMLAEPALKQAGGPGPYSYMLHNPHSPPLRLLYPLWR